MMHIELRSKLIDSASYDSSRSRLKLYLATGQIREFSDVPGHVIEDLRKTASPGSYYMKMIRKQYPPAG